MGISFDMVHSGLWFATCAAAHEHTGLLQATVGMHGHLGTRTHSDTAEALTRMEVSFQNAIQQVANGTIAAASLPSQDVLDGINETMTQVIGEVDVSWTAAQKQITDGI